MIRRKFCQLMKSSPLNYIINIHIEQIMYINVCIPMLITHAKENRELKGKKEPRQSRVYVMEFNFFRNIKDDQ